MWYLIVSFPDLCNLTYFVAFNTHFIPSGPAALPYFKDFDAVSTSRGEVEKTIRVCSGPGMSGPEKSDGKVTFVTSSSVRLGSYVVFVWTTARMFDYTVRTL